MPHFKNQSNELYFLTEDDLAEGWLERLPPGLAQITDEEAQAIGASTAATPDIRDAVARAVDQKLDALARSWRYRDYISARSYRDDPNPRFAAEAAALITHGSACWTVLDDLESAVLAGTAQMPATVDDVLALLPPEPARPT